MSCQNNKGSIILNGDYESYDYASHHTSPFGSGQSSGTHSSIDAYLNEPQLGVQVVLLGPGTASTGESVERHTKAIKEQLAAITNVPE